MGGDTGAQDYPAVPSLEETLVQIDMEDADDDAPIDRGSKSSTSKQRAQKVTVGSGSDEEPAVVVAEREAWDQSAAREFQQRHRKPSAPVTTAVSEGASVDLPARSARAGRLAMAERAQARLESLMAFEARREPL